MEPSTCAVYEVVCEIACTKEYVALSRKRKFDGRPAYSIHTVEIRRPHVGANQLESHPPLQQALMNPSPSSSSNGVRWHGYFRVLVSRALVAPMGRACVACAVDDLRDLLKHACFIDSSS